MIIKLDKHQEILTSQLSLKFGKNQNLEIEKTKMLSTLRSPFFIALSWFLLHTVVSNLNDVLMKFLDSSLHPLQVAWMRFVSSFFLLLPLLLYFKRKKKINYFISIRKKWHLGRALLLSAGIILWCHGLQGVHLALGTLITFTIPFFELILAALLLKERVHVRRWWATFLGMIGVFFTVGPSEETFNPYALVLLFSTIIFSLLDVVNKKLVDDEPLLTMLFYTSLGTSLLGFFPAMVVWQTPAVSQWGLALLLGLGANLILYFALRAFRLADLSALAPFRYLELFFSYLFGFFLFGESPSFYAYLGALFILPATFFVSLAESR